VRVGEAVEQLIAVAAEVHALGGSGVVKSGEGWRTEVLLRL
jgi:hypothetical protein